MSPRVSPALPSHGITVIFVDFKKKSCCIYPSRAQGAITLCPFTPPPAGVAGVITLANIAGDLEGQIRPSTTGRCSRGSLWRLSIWPATLLWLSFFLPPPFFLALHVLPSDGYIVGRRHGAPRARGASPDRIVPSFRQWRQFRLHVTGRKSLQIHSLAHLTLC